MTEGLEAILGERWGHAHLIVLETEAQEEEMCLRLPSLKPAVGMEDVLSS